MIGGGSSVYYLGIDIGGTKVSIALYCDLKKKIIAFKSSEFIDYYHVEDEIIKNIFLPAQKLLDIKNLSMDDIDGIGLSFAGNIETSIGYVSRWPNRVTWKGFPLLSFLENLFKTKVLIEEDANCAALGEHIHLKELDSYNGCLIYCGIGTGIGGGIILNNELYKGESGTAADIGHYIINKNNRECKCGKVGCLQTYRKDIITNKEFQKILAKVIYDLSFYLDIYHVVLGGGVIEFYPEVTLNIINEFDRLKYLDYRNVLIQKSNLYGKNGVWGALSIIYQSRNEMLVI